MRSRLSPLVKEFQTEILSDWLKEQLSDPNLRKELIKETELREHSQEFLTCFATALDLGGNTDIASREWEKMRALLSDISRSRALQGFNPAETATFIFSLKSPVFSKLRKEVSSTDELFAEIRAADLLIDKLGLFTTQVFQKSREEVIIRQQAEMLELSTPVVKLWEGILALPMIGTLDSSRTQVVMETLLQRIVETGATVAIIDITGVPTVDTLVAQHLMKTVAAARLMGAECILSGIRPQIAQTIVHLAVDLGNIVTKTSMADAFALALDKLNLKVVHQQQFDKKLPESSNYQSPANLQ